MEYNIHSNFEKAAKIFAHGCETYAEPECCNRLAYMKAIGKGTAKNMDEAIPLAEQACAAKPSTCLSAALFNLSLKRFAKASEYFQRACEEGSIAPACTRLADMKLKGKAGDVTHLTGKEVLHLLDKACEMGDPPACINASALLAGKAKALAEKAGIKEDQKRSIKYRDRAVQLTQPAKGGSATT